MARSVLSLTVLCVLCAGCSTHIPEKVTTDGLLAIRPGMTYEEVESLIGPPLCITESTKSATDQEAVDTLVRGCGLLRRSTMSVPQSVRHATRLSLSYAEPRASLLDPNIYVNLEAGHVVGVYIKKDDFGICCMDGLPTSPFYWVGSRELLKELIGR